MAEHLELSNFVILINFVIFPASFAEYENPT